MKKIKVHIKKQSKSISKVQKLEYGDKYYSLGSSGIVEDNIWFNDDVDDNCFAFGNVYKTKEEASFAKEKRLIEVELQRFVDEYNYDAAGVAMFYDLQYERIDFFVDSGMIIQGAIRFTDIEIAKQAIEKIGEERIKKYIFGVEDND